MKIVKDNPIVLPPTQKQRSELVKRVKTWSFKREGKRIWLPEGYYKKTTV